MEGGGGVQNWAEAPVQETTEILHQEAQLGPRSEVLEQKPQNLLLASPGAQQVSICGHEV